MKLAVALFLFQCRLFLKLFCVHVKQPAWAAFHCLLLEYFELVHFAKLGELCLAGLFTRT